MTAPTMTNARSAAALCVRSPAKINLTLQVLGRRDDGFHDIRSVVLGVDLKDEVRVRCAEPGTLSLSCDHPSLPTGESNLILKAARALVERGDAVGARIELLKRIPIAAGLGGGSSNAAATLLVLDRLWGLNLSGDEFLSIGQRLGSDVCLFFAMPAARIHGRGEKVEPIRLRWSGWILLVHAGQGVSTQDVYRSWSPDDSCSQRRDGVDPIVGASSADELAALCFNELEPAVFRVAPKVKALHESVGAAGAAHARISGAGQTVFVLFDERAEARSFRDKLVSSGIGTEAVVVRALTSPLEIS